MVLTLINCIQVLNKSSCKVHINEKSGSILSPRSQYTFAALAIYFRQTGGIDAGFQGHTITKAPVGKNIQQALFLLAVKELFHGCSMVVK